jgi:hypothetical protein
MDRASFSVHALLKPAVAALALGLVVMPEPAAAQFGIDRAIKKIIKVPKVLNQQPNRPSGGSAGGGSSGSSSDDSSSENSSSDDRSTDKNVKAEIKRLEQGRIQRAIAKDDKERREASSAHVIERKRDVEQAVDDFLDCLRGLHGVNKADDDAGGLCSDPEPNSRVKPGLISQVTAGEVKREIEEAYKQAQLFHFERLAGELWTRERLQVRILDRSAKQLLPYFEGVGARGPSVDDIRKVFQRVARVVYAEALEIGEVIGVSQSFDRFVRTIYEKSPKTSMTLWTYGADSRYDRFVTAYLSAVPRQKYLAIKSASSPDEDVQAADPLGLERQFKFRYRARRVVFDCLTVNYERFAGKKQSAGGMEVQQQGQGAAAGALGSSGVETGVLKGRMEQASAGGARDGDAMVQESAWQRAQQFVETSCRDNIDNVAKSGIMPESARWISTKALPAAQPANGPAEAQ